MNHVLIIWLQVTNRLLVLLEDELRTQADICDGVDGLFHTLKQTRYAVRQAEIMVQDLNNYNF